MYSLKKFKHLDNNYMLVQLDDKVKNNFLSSFLIGIDNKFLKLDTADLNESTDYYKNKLNDKVVKKFDGKKFNKLNKKHLTYLADLCKMNLVIFDLDKLDLKFSTDLNKKNKTVYLFKHGKKEYLLMKQNMRGMVSKLPVGIYEQFGGMEGKRERGPQQVSQNGNLKRIKTVCECFDKLQDIIYDDKKEYYKDRVSGGNIYNKHVTDRNLVKKPLRLESYYFTDHVPVHPDGLGESLAEAEEAKRQKTYIATRSPERKNVILAYNSQGSPQGSPQGSLSSPSHVPFGEIISLSPDNVNNNLDHEMLYHMFPEGQGGGGNYNNGKADYNPDHRVILIRYVHDPEHDFNKPLPRNKSDSNLFLSRFNYTDFYDKSLYNNFTNLVQENSKIENSTTINKSNIEDLYLKDIIDNDAKHSFLTYKTDVEEFLNIFNKIKNKPPDLAAPDLTDAENATLNLFKSKINDILNKFKYYEYDALNVTSPLSEEEYSGDTFEKYDSLCSIIDGGGVESVDVEDDIDYYNELYDSYFDIIKAGIQVKNDFTIKFSYSPTAPKKYLQVTMSMPAGTIFDFKKGGFKVDNLACMMMMIENTTDGAAAVVNDGMFAGMFAGNAGLNELYMFINHIWENWRTISESNNINHRKKYLYRLLFTLKVIGDQGQADFVNSWNNRGGNNNNKMILVTGDRMLFHYCVIKEIPVYFQNKDYIIINTNESIYENIYKNLIGFDTSLFPDAPDTATSVPAKDNFCIIRINEYIDDLIVAKGENFYNDLRAEIISINGYNLENFNEVIYNNDGVLFCEELDEIKDKVIEKYLSDNSLSLLDEDGNDAWTDQTLNLVPVNEQEQIQQYISNNDNFKLEIINYIKSKIGTIYDIKYSTFVDALPLITNHYNFFDKLYGIINDEFNQEIKAPINKMSITRRFSTFTPSSETIFQSNTNRKEIMVLRDIKKRITNSVHDQVEEQPPSLQNIVKIISELLKNTTFNNVLKENYLEYLKERLIKIKKNEFFNTKSDTIIGDVLPPNNQNLLKEFIRKRVEKKFPPPAPQIDP